MKGLTLATCPRRNFNNVRSGSKADISPTTIKVRYVPKPDIVNHLEVRGLFAALT